MDHIWTIIGQIAVLLGAIYTTLKIAEMIKKGRTGLIAKIEPLEINIPFRLYELRRQLTQHLSYDALYKIKETVPEAHEALREIVNDIEIGKLRDAFIYYKGCWHISLKNKSDKPYRKVTLKIPNIVYISVRQQNETNELDVDDFIKIEEILPDETISVIAWTEQHLSYSQIENMRLNHSEGKGRIIPIQTVPYGSPISKASYHLKKMTPPFIFAAIIIAMGTTAIISMIYESSGK